MAGQGDISEYVFPTYVGAEKLMANITSELASDLPMGNRTLWNYLDTLRLSNVIYQDSIYWFFDRYEYDNRGIENG